MCRVCVCERKKVFQPKKFHSHVDSGAVVCHQCGLGMHEPTFVAAVEMKSLQGETLGYCFHCGVAEYSEGASQSYGKFSGSAAMP